MLYVFFGTDREKARSALTKALQKKTGDTVRITDAHTPADLGAALRGGGMFGGERTVVFEGILSHVEMRDILLKELKALAEASEKFYILEEKIDAAMRRSLEKYAESVEKFDATKTKEDTNIFALASALRRRDKKTLWVGYQRALARDERPEAIHGILFWGAKKAFLDAHAPLEKERAAQLVAALAELPHEARRKGFDFELALERFMLSI